MHMVQNETYLYCGEERGAGLSETDKIELVDCYGCEYKYLVNQHIEGLAREPKTLSPDTRLESQLRAALKDRDRVDMLYMLTLDLITLREAPPLIIKTLESVYLGHEEYDDFHRVCGMLTGISR